MTEQETILQGLRQKFPFLFVEASAEPTGPSDTDLTAGMVRFTTALALASIEQERIEDDDLLAAAAQWLARPSPGLPLGLLDLYLKRAGRKAVRLFGLELRSRELELLFVQDLRNLVARLRRSGAEAEAAQARTSLIAELGYFYLVNFKSELKKIDAQPGETPERLVLCRPPEQYLGLYPFLTPAGPTGLEICLGADADGVLVARLPSGGAERRSDPRRARALAESWLRWGDFESAREVLGGLRERGELAGEHPALLASRYLTLALRSLQRGELERAAFGAEQAVRVRPELAQGVYLLVNVYRRMGQPKRAQEILEDLAERLPELRRPLEMLGDLARQKGGLAEAARLYERAAALDPDCESLADKVQRLRARLLPARDAGAEEAPSERGGGSRIEELLEDLTQEAETGRFEPLQGREAELAQMIEILSCRQKRNVIVLGDAGVGKSALVEELARRMAAGEVPQELARKRLFMMSVATLLAGAKYRGQFEERILELLRELREVEHVLFIDHLHTLINSGLTRGGGLDASGLLKPALVRGEIQVIGSTTYDDYQNSIEKDPTLARCFQSVALSEPSLEETLDILRAMLPRLQEHHHVSYDAKAIERPLGVAVRLLHEGRLPDKAIDLLDRAGARTGLAFRANQRSDACVGEVEILEALSGMARVPVPAVEANRGTRLASMEAWLDERVIGQTGAVQAVSQVLRANEQGFKLHPERPNGVFLFMGPTGVGKTALARALADFLFSSEESLVRIDMSEYMDRINSSRLIGSAPGYVGYNDQNQLTDAVRQNPYCIMLLDEIEKADGQLLQLFLQVFDAGRLTDGRGRTVRFHHATVIMTSNVGSDLFLRDPVGYRTQAAQPCVSRAELMHQLRQRFSPEFLNRIDEIVLFDPLDEEAIMRIARLELRPVQAGLERDGRSLVLEPEALRLLAHRGYSFEFGARNLHRVLRRLVLEPLSRLSLARGWARTRTIRVRAAGEGLEVVAEDSEGAPTLAESVEVMDETASLVPATES